VYSVAKEPGRGARNSSGQRDTFLVITPFAMTSAPRT